MPASFPGLMTGGQLSNWANRGVDDKDAAYNPLISDAQYQLSLEQAGLAPQPKKTAPKLPTARPQTSTTAVGKVSSFGGGSPIGRGLRSRTSAPLEGLAAAATPIAMPSAPAPMIPPPTGGEPYQGKEQAGIEALPGGGDGGPGPAGMVKKAPGSLRTSLGSPLPPPGVSALRALTY